MFGIEDKAVLADVSIKWWTGRKFDREITDNVNEDLDASDDTGRYNKLLVPASAMQPVQKAVTRARQKHERLTQPWLQKGARLLSNALYLEYAEAMKERREEFESEVRKFLALYPTLKERRRAEMGRAFREDDYPTVERLTDRFRFRINFLPCPADDFRLGIAKEHAEEMRKQIEASLRLAVDEAMADPINRVIETVGCMAAKLKAYKPAVKAKDGDGKMVTVEKAESVFRDSLVDNVRELVRLLPAFNLTGSDGLDRLTADIESKLCAHDADALRGDAEARATVAAEAEAIMAEAKDLLG